MNTPPDHDPPSAHWTALHDQAAAILTRSPNAEQTADKLAELLIHAADAYGRDPALHLAASVAAAIAEENLRLQAQLNKQHRETRTRQKRRR